MIPRAAPYDIVGLKFYTIHEKETMNSKAMKDALWFYTTIPKLRFESDLCVVLTNFMVASCKTDLSFAAKETICKNVEHSFEQFQWNFFAGGNSVSLANGVYNSKSLCITWIFSDFYGKNASGVKFPTEAEMFNFK